MTGKISDDIKSAAIRHYCRSVEFRKYFYTHDRAMIQCFVNPIKDSSSLFDTVFMRG